MHILSSNGADPWLQLLYMGGTSMSRSDASTYLYAFETDWHWVQQASHEKGCNPILWGLKVLLKLSDDFYKLPCQWVLQKLLMKEFFAVEFSFTLCISELCMRIADHPWFPLKSTGIRDVYLFAFIPSRSSYSRYSLNMSVHLSLLIYLLFWLSSACSL